MTKYISSNKFFFISTAFFSAYLLFFHYPFFIYELGVLTTYVSDINALSEISFWGALTNNSYQDIPLDNPIKFNLMAILLALLGNFFTSKIIFTIFPLVFTIISFFLFLKILDFYQLDKVWSLTLAFLGLTSISSSPFFQNTLLFLSGRFELLSTPGYFDLLTSFSTAVILTMFLFLFYATLKLQSLKSKPIIIGPGLKISTNLFALLTGFSIFVHPSIFIFSYSFLFLSMFIKELRSKINRNRFNTRKFLTLAFIPLLMAIPYLIIHIGFYGEPDLLKEIHTHNQISTLVKPFILYSFLPLILAIISSNIFMVDPYELLIKFWPILLMSIIEIIIRCISVLNIIPIDIEIIINRISIYFLHFFYYVPCLTIVSRNFSYLPVPNSKSKKFQHYIRKVMSVFGKTLKIPIGFIFLVIVSVSSYSAFSTLNSSYINNHVIQLNEVFNKIETSLNLKNRNFIFSSIDNNLITSFQGKNNNKLNFFLLSGSDRNKDSVEYDFLNSLLSSHKNLSLQTLNIKNVIIDDDFSNFFDQNTRQRTLLGWLKYSHSLDRASFYNTKDTFEVISKTFFNSYALITNKQYVILNDLDFLETEKIDEYYLYYKK